MKATKGWALIVTLQVLILLGQWVGVPVVSRVQAQVPDSGAQQNQIIDSLKSIDTKLDRIGDLLASGKLQVKATLPDDKDAQSRDH